MKLNIDAHLYCLGPTNDVYVTGGYFDEFTLHENLEHLSRTGLVTGLNMIWPTAPLPEDPVKCAGFLKQYGLKVSYILAGNFLDKEYKHGAFSTTETGVLKKSVEMCKRGIDFAGAVNADSVLLWPAHDGFDYPFQVNYYDAWKRLAETMAELAEYAGDLKLAIEPKPRDPRQKMLVSGVGTALHLINEVSRENLGCALDIGHSIAAQENMANALTMLATAGKLYQIHLNDNYKDADPDMIVGSISFIETLEMFYYLVQTDFSGWCSVDIKATRVDRVKSLETAVRMTQRYYNMARKLLERKDELEFNMRGYEFSDNIELIYELLFKS